MEETLNCHPISNGNLVLLLFITLLNTYAASMSPYDCLNYTVFPGNQKPVKRPMSDPTLDVGVDIQVPTVSQDRTIRFRERSVLYTEVFPRNPWRSGKMAISCCAVPDWAFDKKTCFKTPEFPFMDGVTWSLRLLHNAVNFILLAILEPHAQDDMAGDVEVGRGVYKARNLGLEWISTRLQDCYAYLNRGPPLRNWGAEERPKTYDKKLRQGTT